MSWAVDDWMAGLSGRALQKVRELESQQEQLKREKQQKQLKLDSTEAALSKQKLKYDEVRSELAVAQRDLQSSQEEVQAGLKVQERLSQELQVKQAQVCSLEGQLDASRTLTQSLTQEVKRLEAELEKLQNASNSVDSTLFSTPCWSLSSSRDNGLRWEERSEYRAESEIKALHARQLQFGDCSPRSLLGGTMSPRQPHSSTPVRQSTRRSNSSNSSAMFPWEREDAPSTSSERPVLSLQTTEKVSDVQFQRDCGMENDLRREIDVQRSKIQEMQTWVQSLEQEARSASDQRRGLESQLAAREQDLTRTTEELARTSASLEKECSKVMAAEQKLKQLQEELSCQRQNAESSRRSAEQSRRELEKEHHRELLGLQKDKQNMEREHQQENSRLKHEIQRAQTLHNTLQAQCDKALLQKQAVEKDLDMVKGKLQWTERELLENQKVQQQSQCKLTEAIRERDDLALRLEQSERRAKGLEEEVRRLTQELSEALRLLEELKATKLIAPAPADVPVRFTPAGDSFPSSVSHHERLQRAPPSQRKKATGHDPSRDSWEVDRTDGTTKTGYPSDREPGEGIDSNDITELGSQPEEKLRDEGGKQKNEDQKTREDEAKLIAERNKYDVQGSKAYMKEQNNNMERENSEEVREVRKPDCDQVQAEEDKDLLIPSADRDGHNQPPLQDLKKQNIALNDELQEVKRELERRLEDLEAQRKAETEARSRLKQVSRKHSAQVEQLRQKAQELKGDGERLGKELEEERAESRRLKEALAALEQSMGQVDGEKETESTVLRHQVAILETQLKQEREDLERERQLWSEKEDRRRMDEEHELESRRIFTAQIEQLEVQMLELRGNQDRETGKEFGETPLITCDIAENFNNNSETVIIDSMSSSSPSDSPPQSELVDPQSTKHSESNFSNNEGQVQSESNLEDPSKRNEKQVGLETMLFRDETVQLVLDLEHLRRTCETLKDERDKEAGRARQTQGKLDALQAQVNSQTQQLTLAFESQSCHIQDLLHELQDRDTVLGRLEVELQGCREEIKLLKREQQELHLEGKSPEDIKSMVDVTATPNPQLKSPILQCEDIKSTLHAFENLHSPVAFNQQRGCDENTNIESLVGSLREIIAGNKELKSKFEAVTYLNSLEQISTELGVLVGGDTSHRVVVQLQAAMNELMQLKTENKEIKSFLAAVTTPGRKEVHPLDSKGYLLDDNKESEAATKRSTEELHPAQRDFDPVVLNEYEHLTGNLKESVTRTVNQEKPIVGKGDGDNPSNRLCSLEEQLSCSLLNTKELQLESELCVHSDGEWIKVEEQDTKLGGITCRSKTGLQVNQDELNQLEREKDQLDSKLACLGKQVAAVALGYTNTKDQETGVSLQSPLESATECSELHFSREAESICRSKELRVRDKPTVDVKQYINAIMTLLGENKALQSWALSVSPLEKQEEMPNISEGVLGWIDAIISGFGSAEVIEKLHSAFPRSKEVSREREMAIQKASVMFSAEDMSSSSNELDLKTKDAQGIQNMAEGSSLIAHVASCPSYCLTEAVTVTETDTELRKESQQLKELQVLLKTFIEDQERSPGVQDGVTQTGPEEDGNHSNQSWLLQQQLLELQSAVSSLVEENKRLADELKVWRTAGDTLTPVSFGEPVVHMSNDSITVVREDHLLVSCKPKKLVGSPSHAENILEDCGKPVFIPGAGAVDGVHGERETCDLSGAYDETGTLAVSIQLSATDGDVSQSLKAKAVAHGQSELDTETTHSRCNHTDIQIFFQENQETRATDTQNKTKQADRNSDQDNQLRAAVEKTTSEKIKMVVQEDNWTKAILEPEAKVNKEKNSAFTEQHSGMLNEKGPQMQSEGADFEKVQDYATQGAESDETSGKTTRLFSKSPLEDGENSFPQWENQRESRSMATQTESMNEGAVAGSLASYSSDQEKCHTGTQTEERAMEEWNKPADVEVADKESADSPPLSPVDAALSMVDNMTMFSRSFLIPADPAQLAERIRRNRSRMSAAFDDTEYEPYGLPEVVMKGFADIPSGPACPYVLRRGLLGTNAMPLPLREQAESEEEEELDP
ncbi:centromere protein F [Brienomyrus brachyistius]|uniref:centromere protein F n=1 Tax=Brienomyrus brachyistius TaxID=42636 RepID=UPI0020B3E911|nr:centromere protein F [Brienomyrus brachyistius]XP_048884338.1 centromere protein F [Brienomyrus brachyistius]